MRRALVLLFLLATPAFAGAYSTIENIEYASPAGERLYLDLRIPAGAGPHPVIVYLHSGAWITGDRTGGPAIRQAARGYANPIAYRASNGRQYVVIATGAGDDTELVAFSLDGK